MNQSKDKFADKKEGIFFFKSSSPYEFYHILNGIDIEPKEDIFGSLIFPEKCEYPCPLIIPVHGSAGLREGHHTHMVNLLEAGFAIFRVHHFESRKVISIVDNQTEVTLATMVTDAFRALSLMSEHPLIDPKRIGIMGWSLGGSTAFYSAWEPIIESLSTNGEKFAAHLPIYPGTLLKPEDNRWSDAPMHILFGADDDYTPLNLCKRIIEYIKPVRDIDLTVYPNSHHSFDSIDPVEFIPFAIRLKDMFIDIYKDGRSVFTDENNNTFNLDSKEERIRLLKETPNILGAHAGGNWEARRQSHKDVVSFFQKQFFS